MTLSTRVRTLLGATVGLVVLASTVPLWDTAGSHDGGTLTRFLLAVAVVLVTCQVCAGLARRFGQPSVVGEMVGGLVLGPSLLGAVWPAATGFLFPPAVTEGLDQVAQLGLVIFVFLLGCELRIDRIERKGVVGAVVVAGMGLPWLAGMGIVAAAGGLFVGSQGSPVGTMMFVGLAMAVTALPVLARILDDLKLRHTSVGVLSVSAAAIGDGLLWLVLAFLLAGQGAAGGGLRVLLLGAALVLVTVLCVRPLLLALVRRLGSGQSLTVVLVAGAIGYSVLTQSIQLHPVVGAFLFGVAVPRDSLVVERICQQLEGFTLLILLPLFFAGVGLTTSVGLLGTAPITWLVLAGVFVAAVVTKIVGAGGAARLAGMPNGEALRFGILMNCRGVTELVVLSIGYQAGLLNQLGYSVLVLVAVLTTAVTGPLVRWSLRRDGKLGSPASPSGPDRRDHPLVTGAPVQRWDAKQTDL
ncbi:cation:proton antiporter [Verrucosispora sp. WMMD573]|uniref:cation:proton antiporter domain-containing protein n=1 Tax=Verrucosispora sp. WMMD573 TaxID=3015149 RepID=UPI00248B0AAE|nr:cation:proton antiporter [Verrucosispora sp. WMMD573]WBB57560.1 cation:proton antiporter [Verrucosispora sp. WMMD573]